ncbi:hypothetical protein ASZ90_012080 [hydrocarbon metagenome]|uniref:Uncharacterized protein n=1 Tax=hydrocarbon metagenome TaxID=938273 RepID=A0A0W8FBL2_9ZZZZ
MQALDPWQLDRWKLLIQYSLGEGILKRDQIRGDLYGQGNAYRNGF